MITDAKSPEQCYNGSMKIYLDVCAIQRPLDTPSHLRIALEAEAILGILALCESGRVELVSSDALVYETERNRFR